MIEGLFGLPRAGKSTVLTWAGLRALRGKSMHFGFGAWSVPIGTGMKYDRVFSNFPVKGFLRLDVNKLPDYDFSGSLILIDEISLCIDSRNWKNFSAAMNEFFSLHGHFKGCDILYASQGYEDTDKRIRDRTAYLFKIEKRGAFSIVRPIQKDWRIDGQMTEDYTLAPPFSSTWIYRKPIHKYFDSYEHAFKPAPPCSPW